MIPVSIELLKAYNVQGPRYTSYPPAPSWTDSVTTETYLKTLEASNLSNRPLSIYIHLPFCEKLCTFCACTTFITGANRKFEDPYFQAVTKEIETVAQHVASTRPVIQFHLGGGTPTYSSPEKLISLVETVKSKFSIGSDAEMSVEVDPRVTTTDHLRALRRLGFNRVSMGVQDFERAVQESINRIQSYESTNRLIEEARDLGFKSVNIDLIYGLPFQTELSFGHTVDLVLKMNPDRLAVYSYAHVPWLKHHQDHFEKNLPPEEEKFKIFLTALRLFTGSGYEYIGMDHFARPTDELAVARTNRTLWRNFMGYTTKAGTDLIGFGMSAIGSVHGAFFQNARELREYQEKIAASGLATIRGFVLSADDKVRAEVIQNLLCHAGVVKSEINQAHKIKFDEYFSASISKLKELENDGLVMLSNDEIRPTDRGRFFLRNLAMTFDAYLPKPGDKKIFSKTV